MTIAIAVPMLTGIAAALLAQAPAHDFPCERLRADILEVRDGFGAATGPALGAVRVRRNAVLLDQTFGLVAETFTLADDDLATAGGTMPPIVFQKYRAGEALLFCTQMRRDNLFGAGEGSHQYALRCLADRDGDGAYESFSRRIRLVRIESGRGPPAPAAAPEAVEQVALAAPVRLVSRAGLDLREGGYKPRARSRITVRNVDGGNVEIRFSDGISLMPAGVEDHILEAAETIVSVPMTNGAEVPILGRRFRFARQGGRWTAAVLDGDGRPPRLHCAGSVVETGDTFTILTPGGQTVVARREFDRRPQP